MPTPLLRELLRRIDSGESIDWDEVEAQAPDDSFRTIVRDLRLIDGVAGASHLADALSSAARHDFRSAGSSEGHDEAFAESPPTVWGPLRIIERIGQGSYGDVYRAFEPRLGREVALKLLRHRDHVNERDEALVVQEAHRLARVRHPNVVTVYGADRIDGRVGVWMELLAGPSLEQELSSRGPLPPVEVAAIGIAICDALDAVHDAGLLHRDIKAQNVLRDKPGRVVLTDFGTGQELEDNSGSVAGTPLYLAPETLRRSPATVRSDLYSVGVLLFRLAGCGYPVEGRTVHELRTAHARGLLTSAASIPGIPENLAAIIDRALSPAPEARFASPEAMSTALAAVRTPLTSSRARWTRRSAALAAVAVLVAAVALGVTASPFLRIRNNGAVTVREIRPKWTEAARVGSLTPDGRFFVCSVERSRQLALCSITTGEVRRIPGLSPEHGPVNELFTIVSNDGRRILYLAGGPNAIDELRLINVDGSGYRVIYRAGGEESFMRPLRWLPDAAGALGVLTSKTRRDRVVRIDVDQATWTELKDFGDRRTEGLSVSPDGRYLTFEEVAQGASRDIKVLDLQTGDERPLVTNAADDFSPSWLPDGAGVLFSSDRAGTYGTWILRMSAGIAVGQPELLSDTGRDTMRILGFAHEGSTLIYSRVTDGFDVQVAELQIDSGSAPELRRVSHRSLDWNGAPDWSPDGRRIAYVSSVFGGRRMPGSTRLVVRQLETGRVQEFPLDCQPYQASIRWWPDGRFLLVRRFDLSTRETVVERIDVESGVAVETIITGRGISDIELAPDASALFFTRGLDETAGTALAIWAYDFTAGRARVLHNVEAPWRVTPTTSLALAPNGTALAFGADDRQGLFAIRYLDLTTGIVRERYTANGVFPLTWTRDGNALLIAGADPSSGRGTLLALPTDHGDPRPISLSLGQIRHLRVHPDGRHIAFMSGSERPQTWAMENFLSRR